MKRVVAVVVVLGFLAMVLGCQQPAGMSEKLDKIDKETAELKANVEKMAQALDEHAKKLEEMSVAYAEHLDKFHKASAAAPAPVKKPVTKVK